MLRQAYANECKHIGRQAKGGVQNQNRLSSSGIQTVLILGGLIMNMRYIRIFRFTLRAAEIFLVIPSTSAFLEYRNIKAFHFWSGILPGTPKTDSWRTRVICARR